MLVFVLYYVLKCLNAKRDTKQSMLPFADIPLIAKDYIFSKWHTSFTNTIAPPTMTSAG